MYIARLHFVNAEKDTSDKKKRAVFDIYMEGQKVLKGYEVRQDSSSAVVEVRKFEVSVSDGNGLKIQLEAVEGDAVLSGIEAFRIGKVHAVHYKAISHRTGHGHRLGRLANLRFQIDKLIKIGNKKIVFVKGCETSEKTLQISQPSLKSLKIHDHIP